MYLRYSLSVRRADGPEFAAGQRRLEHVGGVNGTFRCARADQGMQLVDEQDDLALGVLDFFQNRFWAGPQIPRDIFAPASIAPRSRATTRLFLSASGTSPEMMRWARPSTMAVLADAGLADQHRIILGTAGEHLHYRANFLVAADDWIKFAAPSLLGQIASVALQGLVLGFRILIRDFLRTAHRR